MIRLANKNDLNKINEIGLQIKEDFNKKYDIENFLNLDYGKIYVYEENESVIGFIQLEEHYEILDIINIAVDKDNHNKNIGTKLIEFSTKNTKAEKIMLEVRESNISAIKLYEKNGFVEINRRKKYYGNEDAIIMERNLI
jgi:ribosomal-protein-alanine N-acetyltransferase